MIALLGHGAALALRSLLAPWLLLARWWHLAAQAKPNGSPAPRSSLGLAAKVVLDELFFATELLSARTVPVRDGPRIRDELAAAVHFCAARGWLDEPARYHAAPPPLAGPTVERARSRGTDFRHLRWASGYEPSPGEPGRERWLSYAPIRTAHAWVLEHDGGPRPWLVCVHAYRMGFPLADFMVFPIRWLHHELGLNLAFPVLPFHGPRKVGWRTGERFFSGDYVDTVHMQANAVWDIRGLLGWIRERSAPAVGAYGLSLGALTTALLASLDELDCVIAGIPATDYVSLVHWNLPPVFVALVERFGLAWDDVGRLVRLISPLALAPRVARDRRYLFAATADRLVPPHHAIDLWRHWEEPRLAWYEGSHVSFGWEPRVRALLAEALAESGFCAA